MEKETRKMKLNYAKTIEKWGIFEVTVSVTSGLKVLFVVKMRRKR